MSVGQTTFEQLLYKGPQIKIVHAKSTFVSLLHCLLYISGWFLFAKKAAGSKCQLRCP